MKINRVLDYYYRAYSKAARGKEAGRGAINAAKGLVGAGNNPGRYARLKRYALAILAGPLYWPNTFPTGVDEGVATLLYSLVRLTRPEIVLEIGTAKGNSTIAIAQALEDNGLGILHTIDPVRQQIVDIAIRKSGLGHRIKYHIGFSYDIIPSLSVPRIDFAFIDGDHSYEHVAADFALVRDRVAAKGFLAFHDTCLFEGPRAVFTEAIASGLFAGFSLPTITGVTAHGRPVVAGAASPFTPVGFSICQKI